MAVLGFGYAGFVASVWPLVPLTVGEEHVGLAYGMMTALQNFGLTIMPLLVRQILFIHYISYVLACLYKVRNRVICIDPIHVPGSLICNSGTEFMAC